MATAKCYQCHHPLVDAARRVITNPAIREVDGQIVRLHYDCAEQHDLNQRRTPLTGIPEARSTP